MAVDPTTTDEDGLAKTRLPGAGPPPTTATMLGLVYPPAVAVMGSLPALTPVIVKWHTGLAVDSGQVVGEIVALAFAALRVALKDATPELPTRLSVPVWVPPTGTCTLPPNDRVPGTEPPACAVTAFVAFT